MTKTIALAAVHHDPDGRLFDQTRRVLPLLRRLFGALSVRATDATTADSLELLAGAGALIRLAPTDGYAELGRSRRGGLALGLETGAKTLLFCDLDRALHWAEFHPRELEQVRDALGEHDFTVLGRTPRAFASHPRTQRDTEAIVNTVFAQVFGQPWDVTAAARGASRRAAEAIVARCDDDTIGTDVAWPLFVRREGGLSLGYIPTEGLEFETPDRYPAEIAEAGGLGRWLERLDADVGAWALRLEIARLEVQAALPYTTGA
jgi:hypothetical protein